ncbi:hypothetical protein IV102_00620 [bacterium]|nr:hypothetical protein [bacterium]
MALAISSALPGQSCTNDFHFRLCLQPNRGPGEAFELRLDQLSGYPMDYRLSGPTLPVTEGQLSAAEGEAVQRDLEGTGLWSLRDGDSGEPENCVYYTVCEIERGDSHRFSYWRGLPAPQARVAGYFVASPLFRKWTSQALTWCAHQKNP